MKAGQKPIFLPIQAQYPTLILSRKSFASRKFFLPLSQRESFGGRDLIRAFQLKKTFILLLLLLLVDEVAAVAASELSNSSFSPPREDKGNLTISSRSLSLSV